MPDQTLLESFPTPAETPFVVEHIADEFTSLCPKTGHPDFGAICVRFQPRPRAQAGTCVELKSLKLYLQSFRNEGIFYEEVITTQGFSRAYSIAPTSDCFSMRATACKSTRRTISYRRRRSSKASSWSRPRRLNSTPSFD